MVNQFISYVNQTINNLKHFDTEREKQYISFLA